MFQQGKTLLSSLVVFLLALCLALLPGCALWGGAGAGGAASAGGSANGVASAAASDAGAGAASGGSAGASASEAGDGGLPGGLESSGAGSDAAGAAAVAASAGASGLDASAAGVSVSKDGAYTDKDHVALYLHLYQTLPANYISKTKAKKAGWDAEKGNLWDVCPGKSIGGGTFYNDDGLLPEKSGRTWKECDIDYAGGYRGAKRICYSNDGLIFYTDDHYQSFTQLY